MDGWSATGCTTFQDFWRHVHPRSSTLSLPMAPARQENIAPIRTEIAELHQRSAFLHRSFRASEHLSSNHEDRPDSETRRNYPCYRQRLTPVRLHQWHRKADLHPAVGVPELETTSPAALPLGSATLHANIIPLASSSTTTTNLPLLQHKQDPSIAQIALIIAGGLLLAVIMIILVARSSWNRKGRTFFKGLRCCRRHKSSLKEVESVLGRDISFVGVNWDSVTRAVHPKDLDVSKGWNINTTSSVRSLCSVNQPFYSTPSNSSAVTEQSADLLPGQPMFEADYREDDFQGRLQVEEEDITLALTIALRDLSSSDWVIGATPRGSIGRNSVGDLPDDVSLNVDANPPITNGHTTLGFKNRSRQGSDASTASQETTTTNIMECFSSPSSSRSSMTSSTSTETDIDLEGCEMTYEVKRAQTQSLEIKKGVLVAWQCANGVRTTTIPGLPSAALVPLSPLTLDNASRTMGSGYLESSSLGKSQSSPTVGSLIRENSRETMDSFDASLEEEGYHSVCLHRVPYLVVTCPSTSTIFTFNSIGSSISVDLGDFPLPPPLVKPTMVQKRSTVEQFIMMYET